jgi:hypothetical protein
MVSGKVILMLGCVLALAAEARADLAAGAKAGTLGLGAEVTLGLSESVNARAGFNTFNLTYESSEADSDELSARIDFRTVPLLLDWHPFRGGFRLTAGAIMNENKISFSASPGDTVEFGDREYRVDSVDGDATFDDVAPYLGVGIGNAVSRDGRLHLLVDLGVMFQGAAEINLSAKVSDPVLQPILDRDVEAERAEIQKDVEPFQYYPVLSVGLALRF